MKIYIAALALLLLCMQVHAVFAQATGQKAAVSASSIALKFYRQAANKQGNILFSPYSLYSAFAMVYEGARGQTATEIGGIFDFPVTLGELHKDFGLLRDELAKSAGASEFSQANAFWYQKDYKFLTEYQAVLKLSYLASAKASDFKKDPEAVRQAANSWTEKQTKGKIKDLFPANSIDQTTRLALVNAVYFKGKWKIPFKKDVEEQNFTLLSGEKIKTPFMEAPNNSNIWYYEDAALQSAALPYAGGDLDMLVILPNPSKSLFEIEKSLTVENISAVRSGMVEQKVRVFLPRFKFSDEWNLGPELAAIGMPLAFNKHADFQGIDGKKDLFIQKAVQKVFVEVNEEGTEAAAATGISMHSKGIERSNINIFRADRPFIFIIEDRRTGLILFMGRMADPRQ